MVGEGKGVGGEGESGGCEGKARRGKKGEEGWGKWVHLLSSLPHSLIFSSTNPSHPHSLSLLDLHKFIPPPSLSLTESPHSRVERQEHAP